MAGNDMRSRDESMARTTVAIIAHEGKKVDLLAWAIAHRGMLRQCRLIGTEYTAEVLRDALGLYVGRPDAGEAVATIADLVARGVVHAVFYFVDAEAAGHDQDEADLQALLRTCNLRNTPIGTNRATADILVASPALSPANRVTILPSAQAEFAPVLPFLAGRRRDPARGRFFIPADD